MKRRALLITGIIVVVGAGVIIAIRRSSANAVPPGSLKASVATETPVDAPAPDTILYTSDGFTPQSLSVKKGTKVTFVNSTAQLIQPQADSAAGAVCGSKELFFACEALAPGDTYTFTFTTVAVIGYHDALRPGVTGSITVEE